MRKLLLVLSLLVLVCVVHAESPFSISADSTLCISTHVPDFLGLNLDRFLERHDDVQGGDDVGSVHDADWDKDSLEMMRNPEYYVYIDNAPDQSGGPTYNWYDISDGTEINFGGPDDSVASVTLPGNFDFYNNSKFGSGGTYSRVYVSTNFLLGFESQYYNDGSYADYANRPLPTEGSPYPPHGFFAPFWDDGVKLENSHCYYKSVGGNFVISWNDWGIRGYEDLVDGTVSLQVVLNMTTYELKVNYKDTSVPGTAHDDGGSATVGVEGKHGVLGFMYSYMDKVNLSNADSLVVFVYAQPNNFNMGDPGGSDPDSDGAYEVAQGDNYGPFSWSASSQNNPYGPSQIAYSVELWEDLEVADRLIYPDIVVGWDENIKFQATTHSTSYTIDTSTLLPVPYDRPDGEDSTKTVTCEHYQLAVFATDGWGYTESTNTAAPGGTDHHYWLDVTEPVRLPDADITETTWGAIKASF
jgi:hypothetical protein